MGCRAPSSHCPCCRQLWQRMAGHLREASFHRRGRGGWHHAPKGVPDGGSMGVAGGLELRAGAEGWPEWPHLPTQGPSYLASAPPTWPRCCCCCCCCCCRRRHPAHIAPQLHSSRGVSTVGGGVEALSSDPSRAETLACPHPSQPSWWSGLSTELPQTNLFRGGCFNQRPLSCQGPYVSRPPSCL